MSTKRHSSPAGVFSSRTGKPLAVAEQMDVTDDDIHLWLSDGRELHVPIAQFDFLRDATPRQRRAGVIEANGTALWWEDLMEGISVAGLIDVGETELEDYAGVYEPRVIRFEIFESGSDQVRRSETLTDAIRTLKSIVQAEGDEAIERLALELIDESEEDRITLAEGSALLDLISAASPIRR